MLATRMDQTITPCQLRVSTTNLWKVTLGFLPIYANLYKRLYDQHGLDRLELQEARALLKILLEKEAKRQGRNDILTADNIMDIEEVLLSSSMASLPSVEWSDISESTDGGSTSAASSWTDYSDIKREQSSSTSNSEYSEYSSDYSKWRKEYHSEGATTDLHWMERFSRAVFGEI